jgi:hypothetical protein
MIDAAGKRASAEKWADALRKNVIFSVAKRDVNAPYFALPDSTVLDGT